ncbi:MAG: hypothetical protein ABIJ97_02655 [Bacteroidota bacterium]
MKAFVTFLHIVISAAYLLCQPVPATEENIPFMVTFGKDAPKSMGDDDFFQIFFFVVPKSYSSNFYLRIFDPDCGGENDEVRGEFNTKSKFSIYGGTECYTNKDARDVERTGNYLSGNLLASKIFDSDPKYDNTNYSFGPFNPSEGEYVKQFDGFIFKIVAEGISGDDGNLYQYFFSSSAEKNSEIEGGNAFTYEYTFRLSDEAKHVSHIYPFIDDKVISINIHNFDWDNEGYIRIISVSKNGVMCKLSNEANWVESIFTVTENEKNSTFDIQMVKPESKASKNNNGVIYVTNQYNELLPFYTSPIGGIPKYKYKIQINR